MLFILLIGIFGNASTVIFDRPDELSCKKRSSLGGFYHVDLLRKDQVVDEGRGMGGASVAEADLAKCEYIIGLAKQKSKHLIMNRKLNWGSDNFLTLVDGENDVFDLTRRISELEGRVKVLEEKLF